MSCDFREGEELICVEGCDELIKGQTYIALAVFPFTAAHFLFIHPELAGEIGVNVGATADERRALAEGQPDSAGWFAWRFRRPIVDEEEIRVSEVLRA